MIKKNIPVEVNLMHAKLILSAFELHVKSQYLPSSFFSFAPGSSRVCSRSRLVALLMSTHYFHDSTVPNVLDRWACPHPAVSIVRYGV